MNSEGVCTCKKEKKIKTKFIEIVAPELRTKLCVYRFFLVLKDKRIRFKSHTTVLSIKSFRRHHDPSAISPVIDYRHPIPFS